MFPPRFIRSKLYNENIRFFLYILSMRRIYPGFLERRLSNGSFEFPNAWSADAAQSGEIWVQRHDGLSAEARFYAKTRSKLRSFFRGCRRHHHRSVLGPGHSRAIFVGQKGGHVRRSGYVRSTGGHDQERIQNTNGAGEWSESGLQRGTVFIPKGRASRSSGA